MFLLFPIFLFLLQKPEVPYKPSEEFKVVVDYKFKTKPVGEHYTVDYTETRQQADRRTGGPLPYLILNITIIKAQPGEEKLRIIDSNGKTVQSNKIKLDNPFPLDLGYTDDIKDGLSPNEFNIYFFSKGTGELSRIYLVINREDGTFTINEEVRGKF